ncbi:hypothetical protein AVEN_35407-1 [Araneus ventricosus]|uniref:Uncharacterized protein n=1 Tax=Araneus ventricosus TaxID=182803 RepID=A0A4Y2N915_ARAVE|nr:hypothetical protein AVEN_35407-1 [Araneus ventricosus]
MPTSILADTKPFGGVGRRGLCKVKICTANASIYLEITKVQNISRVKAPAGHTSGYSARIDLKSPRPRVFLALFHSASPTPSGHLTASAICTSGTNL